MAKEMEGGDIECGWNIQKGTVEREGPSVLWHGREMGDGWSLAEPG